MTGDVPSKVPVYTPPPRMNLQLMALQDKINLTKIPLISSGLIERDRSQFQVYALQAATRSEVDNGYQAVMMRHLRASHIAVSWDADGDEDEWIRYDDGEHKAARTIAQSLKQADLKGVALYMVRIHGGQNMGPKRFATMKEGAQKALEAYGVVHNINITFDPAGEATGPNTTEGDTATMEV